MFPHITVIQRSSLLFACYLLIGLFSVKAPLAESSSYQEISWLDLLPKEDLAALQKPPASIDDVVDGSEEDVIGKVLDPNDPYQQALVSTKIVPEFNNRSVRLAAFIVPLDFDDDHVVTEFFMVPYFGACLHLPPPPPNQIVHVAYPDGIKLESLSDAFWFSGVVKTQLKHNQTASSAYSMEVKKIEPYVE